MPVFDVAARRQIVVAADAARVFEAARARPLMQTALARRLLALRALPARLDTEGSPEDDSVFIVLAEVARREVVFGFAGRFWHPSRNITRLKDADGWRGFAAQGSARSAVNFQVEAMGAGQSLLHTETRIQCFGAGARRAFKLYWLAAGPFSGWIREDWLRSVAQAAEQAAEGQR